jgi:hypothetical protein
MSQSVLSNAVEAEVVGAPSTVIDRTAVPTFQHQLPRDTLDKQKHKKTRVRGNKRGKRIVHQGIVHLLRQYGVSYIDKPSKELFHQLFDVFQSDFCGFTVLHSPNYDAFCNTIRRLQDLRTSCRTIANGIRHLEPFNSVPIEDLGDILTLGSIFERSPSHRKEWFTDMAMVIYGTTSTSYIHTSTIQGGGFGLFSARSIKSGEIVTKIVGKKVPHEEFHHCQYGVHLSAHYVLDCCVDPPGEYGVYSLKDRYQRYHGHLINSTAADQSHIKSNTGTRVRMTNCSISAVSSKWDPHVNSAAFHSLSIKATKNIAAGTEFICSYGYRFFKQNQRL